MHRWTDGQADGNGWTDTGTQAPEFWERHFDNHRGDGQDWVDGCESDLLEAALEEIGLLD